MSLFLVGLSVTACAFSFASSGVIKFVNPLLTKNYTAQQIVATELNRCLQYPRCLLFGCCDSILEKSVHKFFSYHYGEKQTLYSCMEHHYHKDGSCYYNITLGERKKPHRIFDETITYEMLYDELVSLPPTHPVVYHELQKRSEFKILYLIQGDNRTNLPKWYGARDNANNGVDVLFLSFKNKGDGVDLFFPNSLLSGGRLALYVAGRILEMQQGWLYDFFIFADDDVTLDPSVPDNSIDNFENDLMLWQPAVGAPAYGHYPQVNTSVLASGHFDFIMIAYHRETLEINHPWVLGRDSLCGWSSQFTQTLENMMLYRNHELIFRSLVVVNSQHRKYSIDCVKPEGGGCFVDDIHGVYNATPPLLKHCSSTPITHFKGDDEYLSHGHKRGIPRPKIMPYYIIPTFFMKQEGEPHGHHLVGSSNSHVNYANIQQNSTECIDFKFIGPRCCSIDVVNGVLIQNHPSINATKQLYEGKIVTSHTLSDEAVLAPSILFYVFYGERYVLRGGKTMIKWMGMKESEIIKLSINALKAIPLSKKQALYKYKGNEDIFINY